MTGGTRGVGHHAGVNSRVALIHGFHAQYAVLFRGRYDINVLKFLAYRKTIHGPNDFHRQISLENCAGDGERVTWIDRIVGEFERSDLGRNCGKIGPIKRTGLGSVLGSFESNSFKTRVEFLVWFYDDKSKG